MAESLTAPISSGGVATSTRALLVVDDDRYCVEASLGACRLLGLARSDVVGTDFEALLDSESRERFAEAWSAVHAGDGHAEPLMLQAPGAVVTVAATITVEVLPSRHLITLDPTFGDRALDELREHGPAFSDPDRSPRGRMPSARECEVLSLLAGGRTDGQIADLLELSPATVQTHVRNAKAKLGARTRAQAVAIAIQRELITG